MVGGFVLIDKPVGMNSTRAVTLIKLAFKRLRGDIKNLKVGHGGTLDPLASGLLIIAVGEGTKLLPFIVDADKSYDFSIYFGEERDSGDVEGRVTATSDFIPSEAEILKILPRFVGEIEQVPPAYSAIKINGERAYDLARAGEMPEMKSRKIKVNSLKLNEFNGREAFFSVNCSKGTYVRSLARDIARAAGSLGYASSIHRTRIGKFSVGGAFLLENSVDSAMSASASLLPIEAALDDIPAVSVDRQMSQRLRQGQAVSALELASLIPQLRKISGHGEFPQGLAVAIVENGRLVGIAELDNGLIKPKRMING